MTSDTHSGHHQPPQAIQLGYWPTIFANYHRYFRQSSLMLEVVSGTGRVDDQALAAAVRATTARHPLLNCRLAHTDAAVLLQPGFPHPRPLQQRSVAQLDAVTIARALLSEGIDDADGVMWNIFLYRSAAEPDAWVLAMVCHHSIGDGLSLVTLFDQIFRRYGAADSTAGALALQKLPETLTETDDAYVAPEGISEWQIDTPAALEDRRVGFMEVPLSELAAQPYVDACRQQQLSLTSLITAALLRARGCTGPARVASALDIRRRVTPPVDAEHYGCFAGIVEATVPWADDIWEHARQIAAWQFRGKHRLLTPIPDNSIMIRMMRMRIEQALAGGHFAGGCAVSNIGRLGLRQNYGELALDDVILATRQLAGFYGVSLITTQWADRLKINIAYAEPLLTADNATRLCAGIDAELGNALAAPRP